MATTETPAKATRTEVVRLRVTLEERDALAQLAADQDRSISSVLRLALRDLIAKQT